MITLTVLLIFLAIGWGIRKGCLIAMSAIRKAADIKPQPAPAVR